MMRTLPIRIGNARRHGREAIRSRVLRLLLLAATAWIVLSLVGCEGLLGIGDDPVLEGAGRLLPEDARPLPGDSPAETRDSADGGNESSADAGSELDVFADQDASVFDGPSDVQNDLQGDVPDLGFDGTGVDVESGDGPHETSTYDARFDSESLVTDSSHDARNVEDAETSLLHDVADVKSEPVGCVGSSVATCGRCGSQSRSCNGGQWGAWSACINEGVCTPNAELACGQGGAQTCTAACSWSACGYSVGGVISGVPASESVLLRNNGADDTEFENGSFVFFAKVPNGSPYAVTVARHPQGAICNLVNQAGTIAGANVFNVSVSCAPATGHSLVAIGDGSLYDFGSFALGQTPSNTFVVTNLGDVSASLGDVSTSGAGLQPPFSVIGGTCTTGRVLGPMESCTLTVGVSTVAAGVFDGQISLGYSGGVSSFATILLRATVVSETATANVRISQVTPSGSPTFGSYEDFAVTVTNMGQGDATDLSVGSVASPWTHQSSSCTSTLAASASCNYVVRFRSPGRGSFHQDVVVGYFDGAAATSTSTTLSEAGQTAAVTVESMYLAGSGWNDYVAFDASDSYSAKGIPCSGNEGGIWQRACIHGGEKRKVTVPGLASCQGVTIIDVLGAFDWTCRMSAGVATLYSVGLKDSKGLADLVDSTAWKLNSIRVSSGGYDIAESDAATWWPNNVTPLPDNGAGTVQALSAAGTIYTLAGNVPQSTNGYNINAHRVAVVTLDGATLRYGGSASSNFSTATGQTVSANSRAVIGAGAQSFLWLEGAYDCSANSGTSADYAIATYQVKNSVFRRLSVNRCLSHNICLLSQSNRNLLYQIDSVLSERSGISIAGSSFNVIRTLRSANHSLSGIEISGGSGNTNKIPNFVSDAVSSNNGLYGVHLDYAHGQVISGLSVMSNSSTGVYVHRSSNSDTSHITSANNGLVAWHAYCYDSWCSNANTVTQLVSMNDVYGLAINRWSGSSGSQAYIIADLAIGHASKLGIFFDGLNNTQGTITGTLWMGANGPLGASDCSVVGGTNPGLVNATCANQGTSDARYLPLGGAGLSATFAGKVTTNDMVNPSDYDAIRPAYGVQSHGSISDWIHFENPFRAWGREDVAPFPSASHRGRCVLGDCRVWDMRIRASDTFLLNRSSGDVLVPVEFNDGDPCPTHAYAAVNNFVAIPYYHGANAVEYTNGNGNGVCEAGETCVDARLLHAVEVLFDDIGDDDGLCEKGEACIFSPNVGAYQGSGDYRTKRCSYDDALSKYGITGVTMYAYPVVGAE